LTSFIAWLGADSRGPTSLYFASDSRISWSGDPKTWDTGRKVFATQKTPEIFGFTGSVLLPQAVLTRTCDFIDRGFRSQESSNSPESRAEWLTAMVENEAKSHPQERLGDFSIFYGLRTGQGMPDRSHFNLFNIDWSSRENAISLTSIEIPLVSSILKLHGSGTSSIKKWAISWKRSDQGNTSRTMFSAFCDSISSGEDKLTGGEPQLIGLYRNGNARVFGVVTKNGPSMEGSLYPPIAVSADIEWRDTLFQRVDRTGTPLKNAQRHGRPARANLSGNIDIDL